MSDDRLAHTHASALHPTHKSHSCRAERYFPCSQAPERWLSPFKRDQHAAAAACEDCPQASACLLAGLRLHAAHRRGDDPYGVYGVYGGVWFEPDRMPHNIRPVTAEQARSAHAARWRFAATGQEIPEQVLEADRAYQRQARAASRRRRQAA